MALKDPDKRREYQREYQRRWREENPDKVRAYREKSKTPERKEYARRYYQENRDRIRERIAERYRKEPEELREVKKERARQWAIEHPEEMRERQRRHWAKKKYGLTLDELDAILARGCAICGATDGKLCIDHDHANGKVRDALCNSCNTGLGSFADESLRLRAAADYLESHR